MEYRALSRGEGHGHASAKNTRRPARAKKAVRTKKKKTGKIGQQWGAVYLGAAEFAEFEKCIQTPQRPTQSIMKGAELIRSLYKNR